MGLREKQRGRSRCIRGYIMTITSRIYPEPMEGAGTDSPQALLAGRTDAMMDGDDNSFISVFVDKKVRVARLCFAEMSKVT